jgi:hypothetical protein
MIRLPKIILLIFVLILACHLLAQTNYETQTDTSSYSYQTVTIQGKKYNGFINSSGFQLLSLKNEVFLTHSGDSFTWEFKDFNQDGYKDIYLDKGGNTPERFDLLLYVPSAKTFRPIKNFENFPAPIKIVGTKYYYSYHKSGCADMNWDSDLFYIKDFKVIRIGNISGRECRNTGIKDGLYIYRLLGQKKTLIKTLPLDTAHNFKEGKWEFIKKYWTSNYKIFE